MKLMIDISKDRYDEIMAMDWKNCRRIFSEEIRAIHDGTSLEECDDCISRQAAIDGADAIIARDTSGNNDVVKAMTAWKSYVEGLPHVTLQPKMGRWIKVTNGRGGHECDLCHEYAPSYQSGDEYLTKYCPNCGAKMEGE